MDDLKSDALRDMDVEIRLDATRRKPRFIIETAEMTPELTRLIQQLTARAAVPIIGYQQERRSRSSRIPSSVSGQRTGMSTPRRKQTSFSSASGSGNSKNVSIRTTSSASATAKSSTSAA